MLVIVSLRSSVSPSFTRGFFGGGLVYSSLLVGLTGGVISSLRTGVSFWDGSPRWFRGTGAGHWPACALFWGSVAC